MWRIYQGTFKKNVIYRRNYGFQEFCSKPWELKWSSSSTWSSGGGHIDCWCDITAEIEDLEYYVTCEDYYPPVMEDYYGNGECTLDECCGKLGLRVISFDCDGSMSDFEPDYMR